MFVDTCTSCLWRFVLKSSLLPQRPQTQLVDACAVDKDELELLRKKVDGLSSPYDQVLPRRCSPAWHATLQLRHSREGDQTTQELAAPSCPFPALPQGEPH